MTDGEPGWPHSALRPELALPELQNGLNDVVLLNIDHWSENVEGNRQLIRIAADLPASIPILSFGWAKHSKIALEVFQHGALDFLEQPLDVQELKFAINRACRRAEMCRELAAAQRLLASQRVEGLLGNIKPTSLLP